MFFTFLGFLKNNLSPSGNHQHKEDFEKTESIQDYLGLQYRRLMNEYNQKLQKQFIQQESRFTSLISLKFENESFENEFSSIIQELTTGTETFCKNFYTLDWRESPANVDEVVNLIERNGQLKITK